MIVTIKKSKLLNKNPKIIDSKWYEFEDYNIGIIKHKTKENEIRFKIGIVAENGNACEDENYILEYGDNFNPKIFQESL